MGDGRGFGPVPGEPGHRRACRGQGRLCVGPGAASAPPRENPTSSGAPDWTGVLVWRFATKGLTLNEITSGYVRQIKRGSKGSVASNNAATVDGSKARRLEWTAVFDGTREYETEVVVVRGKHVYFIMYGRSEKLTDADRALVDAFLSTVDLPS
jgi:hypothetical protein